MFTVYLIEEKARFEVLNTETMRNVAVFAIADFASQAEASKQAHLYANTRNIRVAQSAARDRAQSGR